MYNWTNESLLKFHPQKCKQMRISTKNNPLEAFTYTMGPEHTILQLTDSEKDIGVTIDSRLSFEKHINEKINKANSTLGIIRRTFEYLDQQTFMYLYRSMARPHLEYANQIWAPQLKKHINAIENVQRRATKLVPNLKNLTYPERLRHLNLPTLAFRRIRGDIIETYKILTGKNDPEVCDFLQLDTQNTQTRGHNLKLQRTRPRLHLRKQSFSIRTADIWNKLPENVITAPSINSFKARLDKLWSNSPLKYNHTANLYPDNPYGPRPLRLDITIDSESKEEALALEA